MAVILAISAAACTAAKGIASSRAVVLAVRHVAVAASETREVSAGATAGNGQSAVARPDAPMSAQIKREVSVRQRSLIR
jgi:hypothetical protein